MKNFNEHESDWTFGKAKTLCYCSSIYSPLRISLGICNYFIDSLPSNIMILSQNWKEISFNLFLYFLVPDSGFLKLAVRLKKKGSGQPFFLIFSRGCFSGDKPPRQPQFYAVWTWSFEQKHSKPDYSNENKNIRGHDFFSSMAFKILSLYDKRKEFLNMFLLQIVWSEKNQSGELKSNKIKQNQDKEDQLDKEALSLVLNIFLKACISLRKTN